MSSGNGVQQSPTPRGKPCALIPCSLQRISRFIWTTDTRKAGWAGFLIAFKYQMLFVVSYQKMMPIFYRERRLLSILFILRNKSLFKFVSMNFCRTVAMKFLPLMSLGICICGAVEGKWEKEEIGYHFLSLFWSFLSLFQMYKENVLKWWDTLFAYKLSKAPCSHV